MYRVTKHIFMILVIGFLILPSDCQTPRLPVYVGRGYDILQGNPFESEGVDPGFRHNIFVNTYEKRLTTQDNNYLIPDTCSVIKTTACSFYSQVYIFNGTKTYQRQLQRKAKVGGNFLVKIIKAAFSYSKSYKTVQKKTLTQNKTLTHASAECQSYTMSIDLFQIGAISQNFWRGVRQSHQTQNWTKFLSQFGTHFSYEVTMGGRATQQIQFDERDINNLNSLNINLKSGAKASFASFFSFSASYQKDKDTTQSNFVRLNSKHIRQIYIGGQPSTSGDVKEWQQKVIRDPMPIKYELYPLTDLFRYHPDSGFDHKAASTSFQQFLDNYCTQNNCTQATDKLNQPVSQGIQPVIPTPPVVPVVPTVPVSPIRRKFDPQDLDLMQLRRFRGKGYQIP